MVRESRKSFFQAFSEHWSFFLFCALDHFETTLYGFMVPFIKGYFFPSQDPLSGLISGYAVLASSAVAAPLGTLVFGYFAQKRGAEPTLLYTIKWLSLFALGFSLLPSWQSVGALAPLLLTLLKAAQGIFASGERCVTKLYLISGPYKSKGATHMVVYNFFSMVGILFSSLCAVAVSKNPDQAMTWWRCLFCGSSLLSFLCYRHRLTKTKAEPRPLESEGLEGLSLRKSLEEFGQLFLAYPQRFLGVIFASGFSYMVYTLPFVVMNALVPQVSGLVTEEGMFQGNAHFLVFDAILFLWMAPILKRFPLERIMHFSLWALILTAIPMFMSFKGISPGLVVAFRSWFLVWGIFFNFPLSLWARDQLNLSGSASYLTFGLSYALGKSLIGNSFPFIVLKLFSIGGKSLWLPGAYFMGMGLVTYGWIAYKKN